MTARDIRYGRRGGRWAEGDPGGLIVELEKLRRYYEPRGEWPRGVEDGPCGALGCQLRRFEHLPRCRVCERTIEHDHPDGEDVCWQDRARLALSRRRAGLEATMLDVEALDRYPDPPSTWFPELSVSESIARTRELEREAHEDHRRRLLEQVPA